MARYILCFILLAVALGHANPPPATPDSPVLSSNLADFSSAIATANGPRSWALGESPRDTARADAGEGICYKIRAYIFKRDDDHAPQFVRSTTCGPSQPRSKDAVWPKAKLVPAN